jgi:hypothetical protein
LQLGLFLFPWMPQSPALRTASGALFGFGVVAFLWPALPLASSAAPSRFAAGIYAFSLAICPALTYALAQWADAPGAFILMALICAGAASLSVLSALNLLHLIAKLPFTFRAGCCLLCGYVRIGRKSLGGPIRRADGGH